MRSMPCQDVAPGSRNAGRGEPGLPGIMVLRSAGSGLRQDVVKALALECSCKFQATELRIDLPYI